MENDCPLVSKYTGVKIHEVYLQHYFTQEIRITNLFPLYVTNFNA